jgi:hypothetical protein
MIAVRFRPSVAIPDKYNDGGGGTGVDSTVAGVAAEGCGRSGAIAFPKRNGLRVDGLRCTLPMRSRRFAS